MHINFDLIFSIFRIIFFFHINCFCSDMKKDLCSHENSFLELLLYKSHKSSMKYVNYISSLALCATTNFVTAILHGLNKMMYDIKII